MGRMRTVSPNGTGARGAPLRHIATTPYASGPPGKARHRFGPVLAVLLLVVGAVAMPVTASEAPDDHRMAVDEVLDLWHDHQQIQGVQVARVSPDMRYAYLGTWFYMDVLLKVDLDTLTLVDTLRFEDEIGDGFRAWGVDARTLTVDPVARYAYVYREDYFYGEDVIREILQIDLATMTVTDQVTVPGEWPYSGIAAGAMAPDGSTGYFTTQDGVFELDLEEMSLGRFVDTGAGSDGWGRPDLLVAPDGAHLYHRGDQGVARVELEEFQVTGFYDGWRAASSAALDPDGEYLFLAGDGQIARVAVGPMQQTHQLRFSSRGARFTAVTVDSNGEHVYVGYGSEGRVYRFDADRLTTLSWVDLDVEHDEIAALAFGGGGRFLHAATFTGSVLARIDLAPPPVPVEFSDVRESSVHAENIGRLVEAGITQGYDDGTFRPEQPVTRQQMASFLTRGLELEVPDEPILFADVSTDNVHHDSIQALAGAEITLGCGGGNFCPGDSVTRAQMASFLVRALKL